MKKIYIAHPYSNDPANKENVEQIIKDITENHPDIVPISPIHSFGYLYTDVSYLKGMRYCLELLALCDELWLCRGWEDSRGCNMEREFAIANDIPIQEV